MTNEERDIIDIAEEHGFDKDLVESVYYNFNDRQQTIDFLFNSLN